MRAFHEPPPDFADVFRTVQTRPEAAINFWLQEKLPYIDSLNAPVYAETSHLFCKGFLKPLLELGLEPDIIILTRPHRAVASSLLRLGTIPARTPSGLRYLLSPEDPDVLSIPNWQELNDYQLCYWYCLEIQRRVRLFEPILRARGVRVAQVTLTQLTTVAGLHRICSELALEEPNLLGWLAFLRTRKNRVNQKAGGTSIQLSRKDLIELEQEVCALVPREWP